MNNITKLFETLDSVQAESKHTCIPWRGRNGEIGRCIHCDGSSKERQTEMKELTHLTATGFYAGMVLCGKQREHDGRYVHAGYHEHITNICPECRKYWDDLDKTEEG